MSRPANITRQSLVSLDLIDMHLRWEVKLIKALLT